MSYRWPMGLLVLALTGCGQDADILARVSHKSLGKLEATGREAAGQLAPHLTAIRASEAGPAVEVRVARRLAWDQLLAGASIEVRPVDERTIELTGSVADPQQRQRAADLAQSTVGVERVVDSLGVAE